MNVLRSVLALEDNLVGALAQVARRLRRVTKTRAWMAVQLSTVNDT